MPIQGLLFVIALIGCGSVFQRFRRKELGRFGALLWFLVWIVLGIVALMPNLTARLAKALGVGRGADVAIYASLVLLFFLIFRCMVTIEKMRREITALTRALALKDRDLPPS